MHPSPAGYTIAPVFGAVGEAVRRDVAAFWLQNAAIPDPAEARRRTDELICVARNDAGEVVAVNTAYAADLRAPAGRYYLFRMFQRPADRHLRLARAMMRAAIDTLRERRAASVRGIALVTENRKLMRESGRRLIASFGWRRVGADARGLDLWSIEFEQAPSG